jgi:glycosyltransferase involved in cell wall biosynthesis
MVRSVINIPKFSVLLSVYKDELSENLNDCLFSIYDSQVLKPDEIVLIKDGPLTKELENVISTWTNRLPDILNAYSLSENCGLAIALNFGLQKCSYELVARMDSDDISLPNRFLKQVSFMVQNTHISVLSSYIDEYDAQMTKYQGVRRLPLLHSDIAHFAKSRNPISHPAAIFRKSAVLSVGGYPIFQRAQDYALWSLMITKGFKFANLKEVLLYMRTGGGLLKRRGLKYFKNEYYILIFQYKIGLINSFELIRNLFIRLFFRSQPNYVKALLYRLVKIG